MNCEFCDDLLSMSDIPRHWRLKAQRYALVGERCEGCGSFIFPPRDMCPECSSRVSLPNIDNLIGVALRNGSNHQRERMETVERKRRLAIVVYTGKA